jgi:hexosaminidase
MGGQVINGDHGSLLFIGGKRMKKKLLTLSALIVVVLITVVLAVVNEWTKKDDQSFRVDLGERMEIRQDSPVDTYKLVSIDQKKNIKKNLYVKVGQTKLALPQVPVGYRVSIYGSDTLPVIGLDGKINTPLIDMKVNLLFKVEDKSNPDKNWISSNISVTVPGKYKQSAHLNKQPIVIPSLREWHGRTGSFTLTESSRIVVDLEHKEALQKAAEETKLDLKNINGLDVDIVYGTPNAGDLYLSIDPSLKSLGEEGYVFDVNDYVSITSSAVTGAFYGTRTALQILKLDEGHDNIPKGISRDYPKYESRGLMLDVARKFYTIDFLRDYVKLMSWYKMNRFQIHLNDDVGIPFADGSTAAFRLESETYPGLTSKNGSYSKDEFRALQQLGMDYGVNVVPEIDTPGHSGAFIHYDPSLGKGYELNISRPQSVEFIKALLDEYIDGPNPTFIGPDIHIGTDEYSGGGGTETFRKYMDTLIKYINDKGKHPRLWGGLTVYNGKTPISTEATMDIWHEPYGGAKQAINLGYNIVNVYNYMLYIVPTRYSDYLNGELLYNSWEPNSWGSTILPYGHPNLKGGMFALWNDVSEANGVSMDDSHAAMLPAMQVLSEKMWAGTSEKSNYKQFLNTAAELGDAPNADRSRKLKVDNPDGNVITYLFEEEFKDQSGNDFNGNGKNVGIATGRFGNGARFNGGESFIKTPLEALGFGWTMSMWINPDADNPDDAVLMESAVGQLKLKQGKSGKLGFSKENYNSTFNYKVPVGKWTHLLLTGDNTGVTLFVNGNEYVEDLGAAYLVTKHKQTLVLPIEKIGSETNSFKGVIDNLIIYNTPISLLDFNNFALNKKTDSSTPEVPYLSSDKAVDGDSGTRWSSMKTNDAWFSVDLGKQEEINKVVITWEFAHAKKYKILMSDDNKKWTNVFKNDGIIDGKGGTESIQFDPISARYVKFQGIERATEYGYSFFEFVVSGADKMNEYHALFDRAEALLASGKGDIAVRSQVVGALNNFPYAMDSTISLLKEGIAKLEESKNL